MHSTNIDLLETIAQGLGDLRKQVVFVGGATTSLQVKDIAVTSIRATDDVDCIIEIASQNEYYKIADQLRAKGFKEVIEENVPLCRWIFSGVLVDVMPTDSKILGFTNKWYKDGINNAVDAKLPNGIVISILTLPYFLATKLEAFKGRGKNDFLVSNDMEDIITLIDGNKNAREQISKAQPAVSAYLKQEFKKLMKNKDFRDSIIGHISDRTLANERAKVVEDRITEIVNS